MALDFKITSANDLLDRLATLFPQNSILEIRSGAAPGAEAAAGGTLLASLTLSAASPWAAASGGAKDISTTLTDASADATGTAAHFRLKNAGDTERIEGTVTGTGGGGDIELDSTSITAGQSVSITALNFTLA